jgi:hypothetical protein
MVQRGLLIQAQEAVVDMVLDRREAQAQMAKCKYYRFTKQLLMKTILTIFSIIAWSTCFGQTLLPNGTNSTFNTVLIDTVTDTSFYMHIWIAKDIDSAKLYWSLPNSSFGDSVMFLPSDWPIPFEDVRIILNAELDKNNRAMNTHLTFSH